MCQGQLIDPLPICERTIAVCRDGLLNKITESGGSHSRYRRVWRSAEAAASPSQSDLIQATGSHAKDSQSIPAS